MINNNHQFDHRINMHLISKCSSFKGSQVYKYFVFSQPPMRNYPHDQNPLEYRYTFWLSKRKSVLKGKNYENCMTKLGSFETVQQFWKMYSFMKRPSKVDDHCDLMLVRFDDFILEPPIKNNLVQIWNSTSLGRRIKSRRRSMVDSYSTTQHR